MTNRVAFIGPIGSGKTSMSEALSALDGGVVLSFAGPLKEEVAKALCDPEWAKSQGAPQVFFDMVAEAEGAFLAAEGWYPTTEEDFMKCFKDQFLKKHFRSILQWWGTEFRRAQDDEYWVKQTVENIRVHQFSSIYVDDCRFTNEYLALAKVGFRFIGLETNPDFPTEEKRDQHASEVEWKSFPLNGVLSWAPLDERVTITVSRLDWLKSNAG